MDMSFGEFLALNRRKAGLTQRSLAEKLFVSESTVSKWEQNRANPDITVLPRLSELLGVSEHELITASIDNVQRENNIKAKHWNMLSAAWNFFFMLSYGITLFVCFICDLASGGGLTWFWIVLAALLLSASFTTLPRYVKTHRLLLLSTAPLLSLLILLGVCCIYTGGDWFWVASLPVTAVFVSVLFPIYVKMYPAPAFLKRHRQLFALLAGTALFMLLMLVIEHYSLEHGYSERPWALGVAFPLFAVGASLSFVMVLIFKYTKISAFIKTSCVLGLSSLAFLLVNPFVEFLLLNNFGTSNGQSTYLPNFGIWSGDYLNNNIIFIIFLSLICLAAVFLGMGIFCPVRSSNRKK